MNGTALRYLLLGVLLASLVAGLPGGQSMAQQAGRPDGGPPGQSGGGEEAVQQLIDELNAMIEQGQRNRSADPRFLAELGQLASRYSWPWRIPVFSDNFSDGDFTRNPAWTVAAGDFWVDRQLGLRTAVDAGTAPPPGASGRGGGDGAESPTAGQIIGSVLGEIARQRGGGGPAAGQPQGYAELYTGQQFPNAFAVRMRLVSLAPGGHLEIGPYQGPERNVGYRLVLQPGNDQALQLVRQQGGGSGIVDVYNGPLDLGRGGQDILWTRDLEGRMTVAVAGQTVIDTVDRGIQAPFVGFTVVNLGGDFGFPAIEVSTVAEQMSRRP